jgi:hypothetical protein
MENTCHRKKNQLGEVKDDLAILFHFTFAVNAVNGSYGIWTSLKMVLTPLNINGYQLFKN